MPFYDTLDVNVGNGFDVTHRVPRSSWSREGANISGHPFYFIPEDPVYPSPSQGSRSPKPPSVQKQEEQGAMNDRTKTCSKKTEQTAGATDGSDVKQRLEAYMREVEGVCRKLMDLQAPTTGLWIDRVQAERDSRDVLLETAAHMGELIEKCLDALTEDVSSGAGT